MPQTVRNVRHMDCIPFRPTAAERTGAKKLRDMLAGFKAITASAADSSVDDDFIGSMARAAERHRAVRDEQVATMDHAGSAGWMHDGAGKRTRPMTPADLQALADAHYGRGR